jgi:hypothetical protein
VRHIARAVSTRDASPSLLSASFSDFRIRSIPPILRKYPRFYVRILTIR